MNASPAVTVAMQMQHAPTLKEVTTALAKKDSLVMATIALVRRKQYYRLVIVYRQGWLPS